MSGFFDKFKAKETSSSGEFPDEFSEEYVQLDAEIKRDPNSRVLVRPFTLEDFPDIKPVLDSLRSGYTISLINIRPLREKDPVELRRAISKIKKTCEAVNGDIAGFSEDWIVVTPSFAGVYRANEPSGPGPSMGNMSPE